MTSPGMLLTLIETPLDVHVLSPFVFAAMIALVFALIAYRNGESVELWGLGGAILGLITSAVLVGFAVALAVPYTPGEVARVRMYALAASAVIIAPFALAALILGGERSGGTVFRRI